MCDCLVALGPATATGVTVFAKNSDRPRGEGQVLERFPPSIRAEPIRATHVSVEAAPGETIGLVGSRPWWMWGLEHGVNEAGVALGNEAIYTTADPRGFPPALTGMDLVRLGLERGATAAGAVEAITSLLERYGQGGSCELGRERPYWSSFLVADASDAWVVETSATTWEAEQVDAGGTRAISNRTTIPSFDADHRHPRQPVATLVDPRLEASNAFLRQGAVTVDGAKAHLRSHVGGDDGWTICMHARSAGEETTASMLAELGGSGGAGGVRRPVRFLLGSPCTSVFVPVFVDRPLGVPVRWERLAGLDEAARPVLDELEAELERDVRDDDDWAFEAWRRVNRALQRLGR
jgi:hypothetical protein